MEHFAKMMGSPTGIPGPARGVGKEMGAACWPWPGLAQAGLSGEKRIPAKRESVFPRAASCFIPGGKWIHTFTTTIVGHSPINLRWS